MYADSRCRSRRLRDGVEGCALVRGAPDNKWFSRLVVAAAIVEAVELLDHPPRR